MSDPHAVFDLDRHSETVIIMAVDHADASPRKSAHGRFNEMIRESPYSKHGVPVPREPEEASSASGARSSSSPSPAQSGIRHLGENVIGGIIDESENFMKVTEDSKPSKDGST